MIRCPIHDTVLNANGECLLCDHPELDPDGLTVADAQRLLDEQPDGEPEDGFVDDVMANVMRAIRDGGHPMVGGIVIGLARGDGDALVHVEDKRDHCSIRLVERRRDDGSPVAIEVGDYVWWQARDAMWTPKSIPHPRPSDKCGKTWDIRLPRVGYSH
jgi:hypothetical protein